MFHATEVLPLHELTARHERCRSILRTVQPQAGGMFIFSRTSVYYLTGTMGNGILWLPLEGEPVLMVRKGVERCRLESPLTHICAYRSYGDLAGLCAEAGAPLTTVIGAQMDALPWDKASLLLKKLTEHSFVPADSVLHQARAVKSSWELGKMHHAASMHTSALYAELPTFLHPGEDEAHIARLWWDLALQKGHMGMARLEGCGQETFLGKVAAGATAHYALPFNGPTGNEGMHPATPFGGNARNIWKEGQLLQMDTSFVFEGYHSDMSATFWAGGEQDIPDTVRQAHQCCQQILRTLAPQLKPGVTSQSLWQQACTLAEQAGFAAGFMGLKDKKVNFVGHGIGLSMAEWPFIGADQSVPLEENMTLALEPKIALPDWGMTGSELAYVVTPDGGQALADAPTRLVCVR